MKEFEQYPFFIATFYPDPPYGAFSAEVSYVLPMEYYERYLRDELTEEEAEKLTVVKPEYRYE